MTASNKITLTKPDDWHLHVRDGVFLPSVLSDTADRFARAIIMPNLVDPVTTTRLAGEYRSRIIGALQNKHKLTFDPLMTLYLTQKLKRLEKVVLFMLLSGTLLVPQQILIKASAILLPVMMSLKPWQKKACPFWFTVK